MKLAMFFQKLDDEHPVLWKNVERREINALQRLKIYKISPRKLELLRTSRGELIRIEFESLQTEFPYAGKEMTHNFQGIRSQLRISAKTKLSYESER